jgi:hypothetical protein
MIERKEEWTKRRISHILTKVFVYMFIDPDFVGFGINNIT